MTTLISREPRLRVPHHPARITEPPPDKSDVIAIALCFLLGVLFFALALSSLLP